MITTVYFIRHAESDSKVRDPWLRPLTAKGTEDARRLVKVFEGIDIDAMYSSPYPRAIATVQPLADARKLPVQLVDGLKERRSDSARTMPLEELILRQWRDFSFTISDGENLQTVQDRNIAALLPLLDGNEGKAIAIGTHGMALCTILKYFDPQMKESTVAHILPLMPYGTVLQFEGRKCVSLSEMQLAL